MSEVPTVQQLETFRRHIASKLGLLWGEHKESDLAEILTRRASRSRGGVDGYLQALRDENDGELGHLAQEMTVGETYFFRHREQMEAFTNVALAERRARAADGGLLRILSAGCSSGEEPYSLAILAKQYGLSPQQVKVFALDINAKSLSKAREATYSSWALRETPEEVREKWFAGTGNRFKLCPEVAAWVDFQEGNLVEAPTRLWPAGYFDIIFCRNVLMYFSQETARHVVAQFHKLLAAGGFLFLGHAETLRDLSEDFELLSTHNCFYYRRSDAVASPVYRHPEEVTRATLPVAQDWMQRIGAASARILDLDIEGVETGTSKAKPPRDLEEVKALLSQERYSEALVLLNGTEPESSTEARLLRAVLLTNLSEFDEAERLCGLLLESSSFVAGAHYLVGLCKEGRGDRDGAKAEHRAAMRLDPGFAMPYLHLGLLCRRSQDYESARKTLEKALLLLRGEERERLRLFGGGFGRESLMTLCRNELALCGEKR